MFPVDPTLPPIALCPDAEAASFEFESTGKFLQCWQSHRRANELPRADALDLGAMKTLLPELLIYDVIDAATIRFRLAGTLAVKRMGFEPRGMNMIELTPPALRGQVGLAFTTVAQARIGILSHYSHIYEGGRPGRIEMLMLPLAAPEGQPPRVMAMVCRERYDGYAPFGIEETASMVEDATLIDLGFGLPDIGALLARAA
ncbi:PAS domain-containing protein [Parvibaculum sp.]|uniref:PAS domain-containing protein n=1 Tax=Parvibaculum sp. TaxID=2024848 RepID=UPI00320F595E